MPDATTVALDIDEALGGPMGSTELGPELQPRAAPGATPASPGSSWSRIRRLRIGAGIAVIGLFVVGVPLLNLAGVVQDYRVNILGKYLCFALVALGLDLVWGYTGLLSLCQALFFCLGGYVMAMHLSLPQGGGDVRPEYNNIPQFMFFNNVHELPEFWRPFASLALTLAGGLLVPTAVATVLGFFILRSRVRGVYFSIITQALAYGAWLLISRNEMLLGGTNGLTNFSKAFTQERRWILGLYLLTLVALGAGYLLSRGIVRSRLGRVLVAVRDRESRLYFAGYKPYAFKVFAFAIGAMLAGAGGMLYAPQVGIITPQDLNVDASIFMVACVAVGGRGRLWGALLGALLVTYFRSTLTTDLGGAWLLGYGGMFVAVVLFFPDGAVGLWDLLEEQVAAGARPARLALIAAPLAAFGAFVLAQALGVMPPLLERAAVRGIPWKYFCLGAMVVVPMVFVRHARRPAACQASGAGLAVTAPAAREVRA
jgi:urea transport system permease protein